MLKVEKRYFWELKCSRRIRRVRRIYKQRMTFFSYSTGFFSLFFSCFSFSCKNFELRRSSLRGLRIAHRVICISPRTSQTGSTFCRPRVVLASTLSPFSLSSLVVIWGWNCACDWSTLGNTHGVLALCDTSALPASWAGGMGTWPWWAAQKTSTLSIGTWIASTWVENRSTGLSLWEVCSRSNHWMRSRIWQSHSIYARDGDEGCNNQFGQHFEFQ